MVNTPFAQRLRQARERADLSQSDLAGRASLDPSAVAHFEGGRRKPSFENIRALSLALGITSDHLLGLPSGPTGFSGAHLLTSQERKAVQSMIRVLTAGRKARGEAS